MAKKIIVKKSLHDIGRKITTKSAYGSHADMVVDHSKFSVALTESEVLCQDGDSYYVTSKTNLDNGLADPNRYSSKRLYLSEEKENE